MHIGYWIIQINTLQVRESNRCKTVAPLIPQFQYRSDPLLTRVCGGPKNATFDRFPKLGLADIIPSPENHQQAGQRDTSSYYKYIGRSLKRHAIYFPMFDHGILASKAGEKQRHPLFEACIPYCCILLDYEAF